MTAARRECRKLADDAPIAFAGEPLRVTRVFASRDPGGSGAAGSYLPLKSPLASGK